MVGVFKTVRCEQMELQVLHYGAQRALCGTVTYMIRVNIYEVYLRVNIQHPILINLNLTY